MPSSSMQGQPILVVEDDAMNRTFAVLVCERAGLVVDIAENGAQAVELLSSADYALVLMDYRMPVMDGIEATKHIRAGGALARNQSVPIIALTANAFQSSYEKCIAAGMNDWVAKPVSVVKLLQIVQRWLPSLNQGKDVNGLRSPP